MTGWLHFSNNLHELTTSDTAHNAAGLKEALHFPHHIVHTQERWDIVIWSDTVKCVIIVELTVPWKENMEESFERKKLCYKNLRMECKDRGWGCQVMPIEVGCRGFIGGTTTSYLTRFGLMNRSRWRATQQLQTTVEWASSWIWSKVRKSTTAWQNRPPSSLPLYFPPPPPPPLNSMMGVCYITFEIYIFWYHSDTGGWGGLVRGWLAGFLYCSGGFYVKYCSHVHTYRPQYYMCKITVVCLFIVSLCS